MKALRFSRGGFAVTDTAAGVVPVGRSAPKNNKQAEAAERQRQKRPFRSSSRSHGTEKHWLFTRPHLLSSSVFPAVDAVTLEEAEKRLAVRDRRRGRKERRSTGLVQLEAEVGHGPGPALAFAASASSSWMASVAASAHQHESENRAERMFHHFLFVKAAADFNTRRSSSSLLPPLPVVLLLVAEAPPSSGCRRSRHGDVGPAPAASSSPWLQRCWCARLCRATLALLL